MSKTSLPSPQGVSVAKRAGFELFIFSILEEEFRLRGLGASDLKTFVKEDSISYDAERILSAYTWTRLNKLLFYTVMEDELQIFHRYADEQNRLSKLFNAFTAYPNGPVEADIYEHRTSGFLAVFELNEGQRLSYKGKTAKERESRYDAMWKYAKNYETRIRKCLQEAFEWTKDYYVETLSLKSHDLAVWSDHKGNVDKGMISYRDVSKTLEDMLRNPDKLKNLLEQYKQIKGVSIPNC